MFQLIVTRALLFSTLPLTQLTCSHLSSQKVASPTRRNPSSQHHSPGGSVLRGVQQVQSGWKAVPAIWPLYCTSTQTRWRNRGLALLRTGSGDGRERDKNRVWDPRSPNTVWLGPQTWQLSNRKCQLIRDFTWHHRRTAIKLPGTVPKITLRKEKQYEPIWMSRFPF